MRLSGDLGVLPLALALAKRLEAKGPSLHGVDPLSGNHRAGDQYLVPATRYVQALR